MKRHQVYFKRRVWGTQIETYETNQVYLKRRGINRKGWATHKPFKCPTPHHAVTSCPPHMPVASCPLHHARYRMPVASCPPRHATPVKQQQPAATPRRAPEGFGAWPTIFLRITNHTKQCANRELILIFRERSQNIRRFNWQVWKFLTVSPFAILASKFCDCTIISVCICHGTKLFDLPIPSF